MTTAPPPGPADPGEPRPLTRREQQVLAEIEHELDGSNPALTGLTRSMAETPLARRRPQGRTDRLLQAGVAALLALAVLPTQALLVLVLFGVLIGLPIVLLMAETRQRQRATDDPDDDQKRAG